MKLGQLLDIRLLRPLIVNRHILLRTHPNLPMAILNYSNSCLFEDFWPHEVQCCRGLVIHTCPSHLTTGVCEECEIAARPFHKFFNLNHASQPDYHEENLPKVEPTVTEKVDGWFGILWRSKQYGQPLSMVPNWDAENKCHWGIASRGSFDSVGADFASGRLGKLIKYGAINEFPKGYSPIFEIVCRETKVVVDYPFEGLVLLGCVNIETGEELPYDDLQLVWAKIAGYAKDGRPWIRLAKAHRIGLDQVKGIHNSWDVKNMEGLVLTYPRPGTFPIKVKVKFEEYKRLHRIITGVTPQMIWESVNDPMAKWVGPEVPEHFRKWALLHRDKMYSQFQIKLREAIRVAEDPTLNVVGCNLEDKNDRKRLFALLTVNSPEYATIAMSLLDGHIYDAHKAIWRSIRPVGREEVFYRDGQGE